MKKRLLVLFLVLLGSLSLFSCEENKEPTIKGIAAVENTIPESILLEEVDDKLDDIQIEVTLSDSTTKKVNISEEMISESDLKKLEAAGSHEITVTYEGLTTKITIVVTEPVDETDYFTAKVVYPDGSPVTEGVSVQWCTGNNCFIPVFVNKEGIAKIDLEDGEYYIHIENIPAGYTYDPNAYTTDTNNKNVEIKLLALSEITSGEGTEASPYAITAGTYSLSFKEATLSGAQYFAFTAETAGKYTISSLSQDKLALNLVDPYLGFMGTTLDLGLADVSGNKDSNEDINFKYTFDAEANSTYYFLIFVSSAQKFDATFNFTVEKA